MTIATPPRRSKTAEEFRHRALIEAGVIDIDPQNNLPANP
jgi:hypothetical protein